MVVCVGRITFSPSSLSSYSFPLSSSLFYSLPLSSTLFHFLPLSSTLFYSLLLSLTLAHTHRYDKKAMTVADDKFLDLLTKLIERTLCDIGSLERLKFETLVTLHVHQRDIFHDDIVGKKVRSPTDFEWSKQARFYINQDTRKLSIVITDWVSK
jgi:hypothetical protein